MSAGLFAVVLCGGSGSRLWPLSRAQHPKPFLRLPGGGRLIDFAYRRLRAVKNLRGIVTLTGRDYAFLCAESAAAHAPRAPHTLMVEPCARNTAPAAAAAAEAVMRRAGKDALLLVMPADHLIENEPAFAASVARAAACAQKQRMVVFGVKPRFAATGYGYVESGDDLGGGARKVARFVEKPARARAARMCNSGRFLWNAGIFCFAAGVLRDELETHAPAIGKAAEAALGDARADGGEVMLDEKKFKAAPAISLDYAVMEKTARGAVVAADWGWSDIGSWDALAATLPADKNGNRQSGDARLWDCQNCAVFADGGRLVAASGVKNLHIVDAGDALWVCAAEDEARARAAYETLRAEGREEAQTPRAVRRPWGQYTVLARGEGYLMKKIEVNPGARLSLQSHRWRSEHWTGLRGKMGVVVGGKKLLLRPDVSCHIPRGAKHRMFNNTARPAAVLEVQLGARLEEDDIIRYEDIYGRAPAEG